MAMRDPDYILDLSSVPDSADAKQVNASASNQGQSSQARGWIAIKWKCCGTYGRAYKNRRGDAYEARCPKCMRPIKVGIGPGGTSERFFEAF